MLTAGFVFMFVATTPEPQFLPVPLAIVVVAQGLAVEAEARDGGAIAIRDIRRPGKEPGACLPH